MVLAVLARLAVMPAGLVSDQGAPADPDNYLELARSLAEGRGFALAGRPTAYRPPLYPLVLASFVAILGDRVGLGIAGLHLLLGAGTVIVSAWTARRWGLSRGAALVAAGVVAFDPVLLAQAGVVMTETLAAFLVAATLAGSAATPPRRGAVLAGIGLGLATLCRPSFLPAAALATLAALVIGPGRRRDRFGRAALLAAATAATLAPWAARNANVFGEPIWTTTHGGYTLALANNPAYYADVLDGPPGAVWSGPNQGRWWAAVRAETAGLSEPEADRRLRAAGLRLLIARPRDFARATLARLGRFWGLAPSAAVYSWRVRAAVAAWTVPLWLALALGLTRRASWSWPQVLAPALLMALTVVHAVYWTDLRMRAPLVPALALVAVRGLADWLPVRIGRRSRSQEPPQLLRENQNDWGKNP